MTLTIDQLFTPATAPQWMTTLLKNAATLGLSTTSWHEGAPERTILEIFSFAFNYEDVTTSLIAQGGFLDFAASGTVTYTNVDGTTITVPVTPDPSDPTVNPTGELGWLDVLADSVYDVQRILASFAGGPEALINTSVSTYGPFTAGTYHIAGTFNKATYSNTATLSIPPSTVVGTTINGAVTSGGLIRIQTSAAHGRASGDVVGIVGVTGIDALAAPTAWYIDVLDATHFTLRGSLFSGAYTGGGKAYLPTVATFIADVIGSASNSTSAAGVIDVHTVTQTVTSLGGVNVDNLVAFRGSDIERNLDLAKRCRLKLQSLSLNGPKGAYAYAALTSQQLAPLLNPPQIVAQAITRVSTFVNALTGTITVWIANASGPPSDADITVVNLVVQAYAVPLGITAGVAKPTTLAVAAVADVWVPAALNTPATQALFQNALDLYFSLLPIGGLSDPEGIIYTNVIPYDAVLGAIFAAGSASKVEISQATLTLNGGTSDIALLFTLANAQVAVLSPVVPTVTLHSV